MSQDRAPRDLDLTPAEKRMQEILRVGKTPFTPEQIENFRERRRQIREGDLPGARAAQGDQSPGRAVVIGG